MARTKRVLDAEDRYDLEIIGARIHYFRTAHKWSLRELARRSRLSHVQISGMEHGTANGTTIQLSRLSRAFGVPLHLLLDASVTIAPDGLLTRDPLAVQERPTPLQTRLALRQQSHALAMQALRTRQTRLEAAQARVLGLPLAAVELSLPEPPAAD